MNNILNETIKYLMGESAPRSNNEDSIKATINDGEFLNTINVTPSKVIDQVKIAEKDFKDISQYVHNYRGTFGELYTELKGWNLLDEDASQIVDNMFDCYYNCLLITVKVNYGKLSVSPNNVYVFPKDITSSDSEELFQLDFDKAIDYSQFKDVITEDVGTDSKFKVGDIVKDTNGVLGKVEELDIGNPNGLEFGVLFMDVDEENGLYWCSESNIELVTDDTEISKFNDWYNNIFLAQFKDTNNIPGLSGSVNIADKFENYPAYKKQNGDLVIVQIARQYYIYSPNAENSQDYLYQTDDRLAVEKWLSDSLNKVTESNDHDTDEIVKRFVAPDNLGVEIIKAPNGRYFNRYYSDINDDHYNATSGPFKSAKDAEKMVHKHRPTVKEVKSESVSCDKTELKKEDYTDEITYHFAIVLYTSDPNSDEFKKLTHHIENLIDFSVLDFDMSVYGVSVEPESDSVIIKGEATIDFYDGELDSTEIADYITDSIDVDGWEDLDVEVSSVSVQAPVEEAKTIKKPQSEEEKTYDMVKQNYGKKAADEWYQFNLVTRDSDKTYKGKKVKTEDANNDGTKTLNVKNYKPNSNVFLNNDSENIGSINIDFDGIEFNNREEFEAYCKEAIVNGFEIALADIDKGSLDNAIMNLYIAHNNKIHETEDLSIEEEIKLADEINKYLTDNQLYPADVFAADTRVMVDISWGDWKHDHQYCDNLMKAIGYTLVEEEVTEENGSDDYSAIRHYEPDGKFDNVNIDESKKVKTETSTVENEEPKFKDGDKVKIESYENLIDKQKEIERNAQKGQVYEISFEKGIEVFEKGYSNYTEQYGKFNWDKIGDEAIVNTYVGDYKRKLKLIDEKGFNIVSRTDFEDTDSKAKPIKMYIKRKKIKTEAKDDLSILAQDIYDWYDSDMGTSFDVNMDNDTKSVIYTALKNKDVEELQNIKDILNEFDYSDEDAKNLGLKPKSDILNRLNKISDSKKVTESVDEELAKKIESKENRTWLMKELSDVMKDLENGAINEVEYHKKVDDIYKDYDRREEDENEKILGNDYINWKKDKKAEELVRENRRIIKRKKISESKKVTEAENVEDVDKMNLDYIKDILQKSGIKNERTLDLMSKDVLKDLKNNYADDCKTEAGLYYGAVITDAIQNKIAQITGKRPDIKFNENKKVTEAPEDYEKNYRIGYNYLKSFVSDDDYYEIFEDSYKYPYGLTLVIYADEAHEQEDSIYCIDLENLEDTMNENKKATETVDPEEGFEINTDLAWKCNDIHHNGIFTTYIEDTNTLLFTKEKPEGFSYNDEDDIDTIVYRNQTPEEIKEYIDSLVNKNECVKMTEAPEKDNEEYDRLCDEIRYQAEDNSFTLTEDDIRGIADKMIADKFFFNHDIFADDNDDQAWEEINSLIIAAIEAYPNKVEEGIASDIGEKCNYEKITEDVKESSMIENFTEMRPFFETTEDFNYDPEDDVISVGVWDVDIYDMFQGFYDDDEVNEYFEIKPIEKNPNEFDFEIGFSAEGEGDCHSNAHIDITNPQDKLYIMNKINFWFTKYLGKSIIEYYREQKAK